MSPSAGHGTSRRAPPDLLSTPLLCACRALRAVFSMSGAFEPGPRSHNRHFALVAGGAALLLLAGGYFGVGALSRLFGKPKEEKPTQQ